MGIKAQWYIENRVITLTLTGKPTAADLVEGDTEAVRLMQSAPDKIVHLMLDASGADSLPPFSALRTLQSRRQPNKGWVIIFGSISPLIRAVAELTARALGDKMHMFRYRSDALRFLRSVEADLVLPADEHV